MTSYPENGAHGMRTPPSLTTHRVHFTGFCPRAKPDPAGEAADSAKSRSPGKQAFAVYGVPGPGGDTERRNKKPGIKN